jgi:hypothetical protein
MEKIYSLSSRTEFDKAIRTFPLEPDIYHLVFHAKDIALPKKGEVHETKYILACNHAGFIPFSRIKVESGKGKLEQSIGGISNLSSSDIADKEKILFELLSGKKIYEWDFEQRWWNGYGGLKRLQKNYLGRFFGLGYGFTYGSIVIGKDNSHFHDVSLLFLPCNDQRIILTYNEEHTRHKDELVEIHSWLNGVEKRKISE